MCHGSNCQRVRQGAFLWGQGIQTYEEERGKDVQSERCQQRDDDVTEYRVREERVRRQGSIVLDDIVDAFECEEEGSNLHVSQHVARISITAALRRLVGHTVMYTVMIANPTNAKV